MAGESPALPSTSPPPLQTEESRELDFYHGFYLRRRVKLLSLFAVLCTTRSGRQVYGVPYSLALVACGIVADNQFTNAYFAQRPTYDAPLQSIAPEEDEGILEFGANRQYYFMVDMGRGTCEEFPIVPNFRSWSFPHGRLPGLWDAIRIPKGEVNIANSPPCVVSADRDGIQRAHIVPRAERTWFRDNDMAHYCSRLPHTINSPSNILPLRADLHGMFDQARRYVILPSYSEGKGPKELVWKAWELTPSETTIFRYHDIALLVPLQGVSKEFLFARFAWSLFGSDMIDEDMIAPARGINVTKGSGCTREVIRIPGSTVIPRNESPKLSGSAGRRVAEEVENILREQGIDLDDFVYYMSYDSFKYTASDQAQDEFLEEQMAEELAEE